jgi:hypothetical protein
MIKIMPCRLKIILILNTLLEKFRVQILAGSTLKPYIKRILFSSIASMRVSKDITKPFHRKVLKIFVILNKKKTQGIMRPSNMLVNKLNKKGKKGCIK